LAFCVSRRRDRGDGVVPQARCQLTDLLQMEGEVRRPERVGGQAVEGAGDENTKLKRLLADAMLDNVALKDLLGKKWRRPSRDGRLRRTWGRPTE
jgi:hypothetical protein